MIKKGDVVNEYKFEEKLGEGGFGQVWLVSKSHFDYAIKIIEDNKSAQVERDWANSMRIVSPFLVNYISSFKSPSFPQKLFIVMEYCSQGSLEKYINDIKNKKGLAMNIDIDQIMKIIIQSSLGLYEMHERRLFHRDIKLENILLSGNYDAKISDFGLSRALDYSQSKASTFLGTPGYMAQEVLVGKPYDAKVDIYALGVMAFKLCTLEMPYDNMPNFMAGKHKLIPEYRVPEELCRLIYTMISADPNQRPSALEILLNPMVQKFSKRIDFQSKKLIDFFHPDILKQNKSGVITESSSRSSSPCPPVVVVTPLPVPVPQPRSVCLPPPGVSSEMAAIITDMATSSEAETEAEAEANVWESGFRTRFAVIFDRMPDSAETQYYRTVQTQQHTEQQQGKLGGGGDGGGGGGYGGYNGYEAKKHTTPSSPPSRSPQFFKATPPPHSPPPHANTHALEQQFSQRPMSMDQISETLTQATANGVGDFSDIVRLIYEQKELLAKQKAYEDMLAALMKK